MRTTQHTGLLIPLTTHLVIKASSLTSLIKGHHHHSCTVVLDDRGLLLELLLALLQADGIDNALTLCALEPSLHNVELTAVNHERHTADLRICAQRWGSAACWCCAGKHDRQVVLVHAAVRGMLTE